MGERVSFALTVLGSSGTFATKERSASGYLVEVDDERLWLDAGAGTWRQLLAHADYRAIGAVILTHRHPDHTTDVWQIFHARILGDDEPLPRIPLFAPQETLDRLLGFEPALHESFELRGLVADDVIEWCGARFSFHAMAHPPVTLGVRIAKDDAVIAYSADTGPAGDLDALARGADLFVCEATLQSGDEPWDGHLSAAQAGGLAKRLGVGRLVLTHLPPVRDHAVTLEEAREHAGSVSVELAEDGKRYVVESG